ncbi:MAG: tyrosine-type recombinase/integrase [Verrucomicrobiota bacterium]
MKTTYQKLTKVSGINYLYRHESGVYWGRKKFKGEKSATLKVLDTDNRKLAEIKLADWIKKKAGATAGDITLEGLCQKFVETKAGNREGTQKVYRWVLNRLEKEFPYFRTAVFKINPLEYTKFVAGLKLKPRGNNLFLEILGGILDVGVAGGYLLNNPLQELKKKGVKSRRRVNRKPPNTPTIEQAEKIVAAMYNKGDENGPLCSSDFLKFLFLAGIGEAELRTLKWSDVDWTAERIQIQRVKTGSYFYVPFYPWLKPFLVDLFARRKVKQGQIFKLKTIAIGLRNTCRKLEFKPFSPRNFRQACIVRQLRARLPVKLVAQYQGHTDGGVLIMKTYSQVISEMDSTYEKDMLANLK